MMTREEAIKLLKQYQGYEPMFPDGETLKHAFDLTDETVDTLLTALRPVSREQVEKVWKGEWIGMTDDDGCTWYECSKCEHGLDSLEEPNHFCPACGSPMDDEAVDILYNNLKKLFEQEDS